MAAKQRDISVSEFFAKNRHLLGFDNPRKALLTTVKEAVDNSLDACEEAGILPEIWVHIEPTGSDRFKVGVQDNGPGILKKQIPLIFGKLLYGSKFHRLRQSRGQQGIGISAAGMYGVQTTGKPVKIISKVGANKPAHYYEIQIDTKKNEPQILNGRGEGVDIPPGEKGDERDRQARHRMGRSAARHAGDDRAGGQVRPRPRQRRRVSAANGDRQSARRAALRRSRTAMRRDYPRSADSLPPEPKEIKPHPYGVELGRLVAMLQEDAERRPIAQFLTTHVFARVVRQSRARFARRPRFRPARARGGSAARKPTRCTRRFKRRGSPPPATDCISPIGEELILKGLHQVVPGEFYAAATRPPAVYRGNPFQIEVGIAFGGQAATQYVTKELLRELIEETDARTIRQFLIHTFNGLGSDAADKILKESGLGTRQSPSGLKPKEVEKLLAAMKGVNVSEGQTMEVLRYANRVPLQFSPASCAITQTVLGTNWRSYGLSQSRGSLPKGPVTRDGPRRQRVGAVHQRIEGSDRQLSGNSEGAAAGAAGGRPQPGHVRAQAAQGEAARRPPADFPALPGRSGHGRERHQRASTGPRSTNNCLSVAKKRTADADVKLDDRGRPIEDATNSNSAKTC